MDSINSVHWGIPHNEQWKTNFNLGNCFGWEGRGLNESTNLKFTGWLEVLATVSSGQSSLTPLVLYHSPSSVEERFVMLTKYPLPRHAVSWSFQFGRWFRPSKASSPPPTRNYNTTTTRLNKLHTVFSRLSVESGGMGTADNWFRG